VDKKTKAKKKKKPIKKLKKKSGSSASEKLGGPQFSPWAWPFSPE